MRRCLLIIACAFAAWRSVAADPSVYRVAVLADTDKTEGGELAGLISDDLRRSKDVIIDYKSPDFTVSCFVIHSDGSDVQSTRIAASVVFLNGQSTLSEHFPLTADSLQSLAHKVAAEFNKRKLDHFRRADAPQE
jgi:hypothetical protein